MKRIFLKIALLVVAVSVVFLLTNCKPHVQTTTPAKVTITYSTGKGVAPASKTVDLGYKLTMGDVAPIAADGFVFDDWYIGTEKATVGYAVTKNITLTAKWSNVSELQCISFTTSKNIGETVELGINAEPADQPDVWLDLNSNGIKDEGEEVTHFGSDWYDWRGFT